MSPQAPNSTGGVSSKAFSHHRAQQEEVKGEIWGSRKKGIISQWEIVALWGSIPRVSFPCTVHQATLCSENSALGSWGPHTGFCFRTKMQLSDLGSTMTLILLRCTMGCQQEVSFHCLCLVHPWVQGNCLSLYFFINRSVLHGIQEMSTMAYILFLCYPRCHKKTCKFSKHIVLCHMCVMSLDFFSLWIAYPLPLIGGGTPYMPKTLPRENLCSGTFPDSPWLHSFPLGAS